MKKWVLLVLMCTTLLTMLGFPGCYDSRRRAAASGHYYDAPSEATRKELRDAKQSDWRDIAAYEAVLAGFFALSLFVYIRSERVADREQN